MYICPSVVINIASVSGRDFISDMPFFRPSRKQEVLKASPSVEESDRIVTPERPLSDGYPVEGTKI